MRDLGDMAPLGGYLEVRRHPAGGQSLVELGYHAEDHLSCGSPGTAYLARFSVRKPGAQVLEDFEEQELLAHLSLVVLGPLDRRCRAGRREEGLEAFGSFDFHLFLDLLGEAPHASAAGVYPVLPFGGLDYAVSDDEGRAAVLAGWVLFRHFNHPVYHFIS